MTEQDEETFLAEYDSAKFPPVAMTADMVALTILGDDLCVLAIERATHPYKGFWALPGRFVAGWQTAGDAALQALADKTYVAVQHVEQLGTYTDPTRDPRMRVISVAYLAFGPTLGDPKPGRHATAAEWIPFYGPSVTWAFDHAVIVHDAVERARSKLEYSSLATTFLPPTFTITDLRGVYETVWDRPLNAGNFHRKVTGAKGFIEPTGEKRGAARVYRKGDAKMLYPPIRERGDW